MSKFEDPIQFDVIKNNGVIQLYYSDLMEITQGGPEIGNISINGKKVDGRYGGPAIFHGKFVYIPAYVKKFFGNGFRLARICSETLEIEYLGKTKDLFFLDKVDGTRIYFYEDLNKTALKYYEL